MPRVPCVIVRWRFGRAICVLLSPVCLAFQIDTMARRAVLGIHSGADRNALRVIELHGPDKDLCAIAQFFNFELAGCFI